MKENKALMDLENYDPDQEGTCKISISLTEVSKWRRSIMFTYLKITDVRLPRVGGGESIVSN